MVTRPVDARLQDNPMTRAADRAATPARRPLRRRRRPVPWGFSGIAHPYAEVAAPDGGSDK
ncbi:hypothetical protein [Streptomyces sp. NPDC056672]|uniref:hypothetical protein n=1 Tax=Streptomyces sp. NPDC056672 TaxID=3345906 RepID=UPI003677D38A